MALDRFYGTRLCLGLQVTARIDGFISAYGAFYPIRS